MSKVAIPLKELRHELGQRGLEEGASLSVIECECPVCGRKNRITVREDGIRNTRTVYCTEFSCRKSFYPILENLKAVEYRKQVKAE